MIPLLNNILWFFVCVRYLIFKFKKTVIIEYEN